MRKAKQKCDRGKWLPWLKKNVKFSKTVAYHYMAVAEHWEQISRVGNLAAALRLLTEDAADPLRDRELHASSKGSYSPGGRTQPQRSWFGRPGRALSSAGVPPSPRIRPSSRAP